ncbi:MAG TPA: radical SAM family heme chaperone HemW [Vicinamibacterales bacterium]|nr:radical SAM family heme chaperone HemW [Vicinamibacterales bacterium]
MAAPARNRVLGLYVHVPFCAAICNYCNFNRGLYDESLKNRYVGAVRAEVERAGDGSAADSLFFGGGTPSLLEPTEIARIIAACRDGFALSSDAEITLEANPETVTEEKLAAFRAAGVNRLSFGVQSFRDEELRRLSRLHSAERAGEAFQMARRAGFDDISLDLMMWLPQQTVAQWLESVEALIEVGPEHASLYLLEVYPNAPLRDEMARARWSLAPDDDAAEMYLAAMARLEASGYQQYEISNVSRPGRESRHNMKYWTDGEWLGFGCGAHSTRDGVRWKNVSSTEEYIARVSSGGHLEVERREMSRQEHLEETLFTGLRLSRGVDLREIAARFGVDVWARHEEELHPMVGDGLLIYDGAVIRLTRAGMLLAHEVMTVFISSAVR